MRRPHVALALLVSLAGCSYPHLIDDGQLDEAYLARIIDGTAQVCSHALGEPVRHQVVDGRRAFQLMQRRKTAWEEETSREAAFQALGFYLSERVDEKDGALVFVYKFSMGGPEEADPAVLAFYDADDRTFYVLDRPPPGGPVFALLLWFLNWKTDRDFLNEMAASHELVHAFQDQRWGLLDYWRSVSDDDAALARRAVIEGEALDRSYTYMELSDTPIEREDVVEGLSSDVALEREREAFPYWAGAAFVRAIRASARSPDCYWRKPPSSTDQILSPERYLDGHEPERVTFQACAPPPGFALVRENVLGAFLSSVLVGTDVRDWSADRYRVYKDLTGRLALTWAITFRSAAGARAFAADYLRVQDQKPVRRRSCAVSGARSVLVVEAPDHATFDALSAGVGALP